MLEDAILGRLIWEDRDRCWRGEVEFAPGQRVEVSIWPEGEDIREVLPRAHRSYAWIQQHEDFAQRCVAGRLLGLFNDRWNEEGPITQDEFLERIELAGIDFLGDGAIELWYDDGDELFSGNAISVAFDAEGRFKRAGIHS
jgi:hypothetical protein